MPEPTSSPHSATAEELLEAVRVGPGQGLDEGEVERLREEHGPNRLRRAERRSWWQVLLEQLKSVVMVLLGGAAVLAFSLGHVTEGVAILAVLVVNALIGFVSELRAVRSMEALAKLDRRTACVRRDGTEREIAAEDVVPGDIVVLHGEDAVPADLRILEAESLRVEEAALTGESVPVSKTPDPVDDDAPLAERSSMLYKGTSIAEGDVVALTVATGMGTEIGRISELAESASSGATPLEATLDRLGRRLAWITIGIAAAIAGAGLLAGRDPRTMIETAIALGVAAIPEGLPIAATLALARGMWRMARRQAIVNRLNAVETLGSTRIILTDKTGTLTENRMTAEKLVADGETFELPAESPEDGRLCRALEVGVLCSNASLGGGDDDDAGDPTEVALLEAGRAGGLDRPELLERWPEVREVSFDPDVMMMATFHRDPDGDRLRVAVKGAPSAVLDACTSVAGADGDRPLEDDERDRWRRCNDELAEQGLRVMAVAERRADDADDDPYEELTFLGLAALRDPPREGVREAVQACRRAGVHVMMVTGDQPQTARAIARQVGLVDDDDAQLVHGGDLAAPEDLDEAGRRKVRKASIFARVSPEQKLDLVRLLQEEGEIVAMTGDGVNDAPALKQADIGIAMGRRGTEAARQVADMVLRDDALDTIVAAIRQGRVIFTNIRSSIMFMLCTNVAEVLAVALAALVDAPLPLRPLQILYLNVLTDVFPAMALGVGPGGPGVMDEPPREAGESILTKRHWGAIGGWATLIAACVLTALWIALTRLGADETAAVTHSFLALAFGKLMFVLTLRRAGSPPWNNEVVRNPWVWGAIALCTGLLLAAVWFGPLAGVLQTAPPSPAGWAVILGLAAVPAVGGEVFHAVARFRRG